MGSFNEICGASNLSICCGDKARMLLLQKRKNDRDYNLYPTAFFYPITFLVRGEYNDYGDLDMTVDEENRFHKMIAKTGIKINREEIGRGRADVYTWFIHEGVYQMLQSLPVWEYDNKTRKSFTRTLQESADDSMQTVIKHLTHKEMEIKNIKESIEKVASKEENKSLLGFGIYSIATKLTKTQKTIQNGFIRVINTWMRIRVSA